MTEQPLSIAVTLTPEQLDGLVEAVAARVLLQIEGRANGTAPAPLMTIPEAAAYLRTSRQRIDDLLSQRRLERVKDGRRTLVRRDDLDAYLNNNGR